MEANFLSWHTWFTYFLPFCLDAITKEWVEANVSHFLWSTGPSSQAPVVRNQPPVGLCFGCMHAVDLLSMNLKFLLLDPRNNGGSFQRCSLCIDLVDLYKLSNPISKMSCPTDWRGERQELGLLVEAQGFAGREGRPGLQMSWRRWLQCPCPPLKNNNTLIR